MALYNPYNLVGVTHNMVMDTIIDECYKHPTPLTKENKAVLERIIINETASSLYFLQLENYPEKKRNIVEVTEMWNQFMRTETISLDETTMQSETKLLLKKLIKLDYTDESKAKDKILDIEQDFLDAPIPKNEQVLGLCSTSVGYQSLEYWYRVKEVKEDEHKQDKNKYPTSSPKWNNWLNNSLGSIPDIIKKDVEGAIKGGIKGMAVDYTNYNYIISGAFIEGSLSSGAKALVDLGFNFFK